MRSAQGKPTLRPSTALRSDTHLKSSVLCRRATYRKGTALQVDARWASSYPLDDTWSPTARRQRAPLRRRTLAARSSHRAGETVGHRAHTFGNYQSAALVLSICACDLLFF